MPVEVETRDLGRSPFRIGEWLVEPSLNRVSRGDTTIQLELKWMDVLVCLAEQVGEVVSRIEIIDRVWATEFITDNTLTHTIAEIRSALGDDARNPSFIETIHRRGYRLIASVEPVVSDEAGESKVARFPVPEGRPISDEDRSPYPGLAAFTEADAEFFFGRKDEVARMWRKLTSRRMLAVIGPSGVGKSSFLRAGVIPTKPEGWGFLVFQPGEVPFAALARALIPEFEGDRDSISKLVHLKEPGEAVALVSRWRERHHQALLVVDQFEEIFTVNTRENQIQFCELLRRVVDESDVHVLLSMRDDFLFRVYEHQSLAPILDDLTLLGSPSPDSLGLALVEPAKRVGFLFEDGDLSGEMIAAVEGERGALSLLAFAVSRLWDKRDRKRHLLTRQAYSEIGGVGGGLVRHAESSLKGMGDAGWPIVRELFRNLVTAQGTRAARSLGDLITVFPEDRRDDATEVLNRLVAARLLTSFEEESVDGKAGHHRVEVVHESLLTSWPRLVGWQTQDADSARLRDELRQAAKAWQEHGRPDDWLWSGAQYREFASWRERYPGGLSFLEEDFAAAMSAYAKRRKRRRKIAVAALFVALLACLTVVASFWRQSVHSARRAEASELVALGQLELESYPSAAVAYATASLGLADRPAARRLVLEALWKGPTAIIINEEWTIQTVFTSDGNWLIQSRTATGTAPLQLIGADGSSSVLEHTQGGHAAFGDASAENGLIGLRGWNKENTQDVEALWSAPEKKRLAEARYKKRFSVGDLAIRSDQRSMLMIVREDGHVNLDALGFDGAHKRVGTIDLDVDVEEGELHANLNGSGRYVAVSTEHDVYVVEIGSQGLSDPRFLGRQNTPVIQVDMDERSRFVSTLDVECRIRLWFLDGDTPPAQIQGPPDGCVLHSPWDAGDVLVTIGRQTSTSDPEYWVWSLESSEPRLLRVFDAGGYGKTGFWLNAKFWVRTGPDQKIRLWPIMAPPDAEPLTLLRGEVGQFWYSRFHPNGEWLVSPDESGLSMWPLAQTYPTVFRLHEGQVNGLLSGPGGRWLASSSDDGSVRIWPLEGDPPPSGRFAYESDEPWEQMYGMSKSPDGTSLLVGNNRGGPLLLSLGDGETTVLEDAPANQMNGQSLPYGDTAFSMDGRFAAASSAIDEAALRKIGVWDVATGDQINVLAKGEVKMFGTPRFLEDGRLMALDQSGLRRWNVETGESDLLYGGSFQRYAASEDRSRLLLLEAPTHNDPGRAIFVDLETGVVAPLETHGNLIQSVALNQDGSLAATGDRDGVVRVGLVTGEEPYLFFGHESRVDVLTVDSNGRWIASGGKDHSIRLWPMPDLSKPPLHTLPHDELIAKLKTLTNLRVVRDEESSTGWKLEVGPFPGWETVPTW